MLCYTLGVRIVLTQVQNIVKIMEQQLYCFTSRILRDIAYSRQKSLLTNILLIFSGLKILISYTCPFLTVILRKTWKGSLRIIVL
jgi:hypothetical protein